MVLKKVHAVSCSFFFFRFFWFHKFMFINMNVICLYQVIDQENKTVRIGGRGVGRWMGWEVGEGGQGQGGLMLDSGLECFHRVAECSFCR